MAGAIILDTNVVKYLEADGVRERLRASLRAADLELWPTAVNALEAVANNNSQVRARSLDTLRLLSGRQHLLPLPTDMLRCVGRALIEGKGGFITPESEMEWVLHEPERITNDHVRLAGEIAARTQATWDEAHRAARKAVRAELRRQNQRDPWGDISTFLDRQWMRVEQLDTLVELMWRQMELPGDAPVAALLQNPAWRLYLEGFGATVYERAVTGQTPKPAHVADVAQLVYLGGALPRVLVTAEKPLARVARSVLLGRHPASRVMHPDELLAAAG